MLKHHLSMSGFHLGSLARVWQKNLIIRYQMFWWQRCAWIIHITSELSPAWNRGATMTNKVTSRQDDESRILSGWPRRHFHLELGDAPLPQHKCHFVQYKFYPSGSAKKNGTGEKQMEANKGKVSFYDSYPLTQTYGSLEALIGSFLVFCVRT